MPWRCWTVGTVTAQTTGLVVASQDVASTAAGGTSQVLALDGKYSNCSVVTQTTAATATVTVYGNTTPSLYGPGAPSLANTNFGASGVITATTTQSAMTGNVANLPVGLYFTWAGNTGILHARATCTSAIAAGGAQAASKCSIAMPVTSGFTATINAMGQTALVTGVGGENICVFYAGWQNTATNSGAQVNIGYSASSSCTSVTEVLPIAIGVGASAPNTTAVIGTATPYGFQYPAFVVPAGDTLCGQVAAGTTIAGAFYWDVQQL